MTKRFGRHTALNDVSLEIEAGKLLTLLGENGAGKSTLLRAVAGLSQPTCGTIEVMGATEPRERCMHIGYMAHASLLYDEMTGAENLEYFCGLYSVATNKAQRSLQSVGLDPALTTRVSGYSQGMRQRLSLARAILHSPKVLLLDEPFSNTDAASSKQMAQMLAAQRDAGATVLVVTHQPALLEPFADEFVTLSAGKVVERRRGRQEVRL